MIRRFIVASVLASACIMICDAQTKSTATTVTRTAVNKTADSKASDRPATTNQRQKARLDDGVSHESDIVLRKVIYRKLDLDKTQNAPLYYPDGIFDGQENLFRIIFRLMCDGAVDGYEYVDGKELFTDEYKVKMRDVFDRFHIAYTDAKGSTERNPRFVVEPIDVPADEVKSYYIIERWDFDRSVNKLRPVIEAICPVLHQSRDVGGEVLTSPVFWIRYADLSPYLVDKMIFVDDDNNMPSASYDDYFKMGLYAGEIYKTRNLRNKTMMELYPDEAERKKAADSIENRLAVFDTGIWVPSVDELNTQNGDSTKMNKSGQKKSAGTSAAQKKQSSSRSIKSKRGAKNPSTGQSSSGAVRSVRTRK